MHYISTSLEVARDNAAEATLTTVALFQINNVKLYVLVVTLSIKENIKDLENLKQGFRWTISWNKYNSETRTEPESNNLDCTTDPTFKNINILFVLSFRNADHDPTRSCKILQEYYMVLVEIEGFKALIDNKLDFHHPLKK